MLYGNKPSHRLLAMGMYPMLLYHSGGIEYDLLAATHTAMYICITVFVFIPVTFVILWTKMYRIRVNGSRITVRKGLGLVKFSFAITDIRNVQWKVRKNTFVQNEIITVFTAQGKRFKVESLMVNADKMQAFLTDHVEENKIKRM